ncbi:1232_t:CDS:1, partial [Entrophospora sp. SA101]
QNHLKPTAKIRKIVLVGVFVKKCSSYISEISKTNSHFTGLYLRILYVKLDNLMTYDPSLEDDDYNVDNGRFWENLSREKLEKDRENGDFIINPGKLNDMLDQM